jgi:uncharacterized damage-inducible protein DinB
VRRSLLSDPFDHHVWATLRVLDVCLKLTPEQLEATVPGTYGSILDTARHLVGADGWYLFRITEDASYRIDEDHMDLHELRTAMERYAEAWPHVIEQDIDPDEIEVRRNADRSVSRTARGVRLAQVVHHGTDHRSQICTALTTLGIEPPEIDLWAYGEETGRAVDIPAKS